MKKLQFLKTLIDVFWFFLICALVGMTIVFPILIFSSEPLDLPIKINGEILNIVDIPSKVMLIFILIAAWSFGFGIYFLRKLLNNFTKRKIFETTSIELLDKIGKCFLVASLLTGIPAFIYKVIVESHIGLEFGGGFESSLFTASLGLFFMVLSEVFTIGKAMKEDSDLTV